VTTQRVKPPTALDFAGVDGRTVEIIDINHTSPRRSTHDGNVL